MVPSSNHSIVRTIAPFTTIATTSTSRNYEPTNKESWLKSSTLCKIFNVNQAMKVNGRHMPTCNDWSMWHKESQRPKESNFGMTSYTRILGDMCWSLCWISWYSQPRYKCSKFWNTLNLKHDWKESGNPYWKIQEIRFSTILSRVKDIDEIIYIKLAILKINKLTLWQINQIQMYWFR